MADDKTKTAQVGEMRARFKRLEACSEVQIRFLESLRSSDQDQAIKAGGILAFSGLMIACLLVQLSAGTDSALSISPNDLTFTVVWVSLGAQFLAAIVTLVAITCGRWKNYDSVPQEALNQYADVVGFKRLLAIIAGGICALGTVGGLASLFLSLLL